MVVRFIVEGAALSENAQDEALLNASHQRLLEVWLRYGVLAIPDNGEELQEQITKMPLARRKLWEEALQSEWFRTVNVGSLESAIWNDEGGVLSLKELVNLACLEETRASCICVGGGEFSKYWEDHDFEVCRFDCADRAVLFNRQQKIWDRLIYAGEERASIWSERFMDLSRYARRIAIIDRYAGKNMLEAFEKGKPCGLSIFLKLINSLSDVQRKKTLNIFTSDAQMDAVKATDALRKIVTGGKKNLASVHLHVVPDSLFATVAHDRFLRFDALITSIGKGISLFESSRCEGNFACGLTLDDDGKFKKVIEGTLQGNSNHTVIL
jgi:hypothetical protein